MIRSLRLKNFKCFADQLFPFRSLTLLTGLNGMGKSSVLQALLLLRQSYQQDLLRERGLALNGDLVHIGTAKDALYEEAEEERIQFGLVADGGVEAHWGFRYDREADVMGLDSGGVNSQVFESSLFTDDFRYLQAERIGPRAFFEMADFQVRHHNQLGSKGEYTTHFLSVFGAQRTSNGQLHHPNAKSDSLIDEVEAWMGEFSPGTRIEITPIAGMDLVNLQYAFITGAQVTDKYRSTNVGFGLTYCLPILVAVLASSSRSLILLENPEAHLHPKGQVQIGQLLAIAAQGGAQVIVETHSDHLLNGMRLAVHTGKVPPTDIQLHFFQPRHQAGAGRVEIISPNLDSRGRIDFWPENFFDEWDKSLEALLG